MSANEGEMRLKAQERSSHVDARQIFDRHVVEAWPRVADAPAVELTPDQVLDMLRRLIEAGKGRTANKLRSYVPVCTGREVRGGDSDGV
jgi:hypothetical protein